MDTDSKPPDFSGKNIIFILLIIALILPIGLLSFEQKNQEQETFLVQKPQKTEQGLITIQENTLLPIASTLVIQRPQAIIIEKMEPKVVERIKMIITAYSSTPDQTDDTPFITASNSWVRKGIVANNFFPFGTRIRIPEYFGDKIFVIEDRMHWRKSNEQIDVWFSSRQQAINFGITKAYVEILAD